MRVAIANAESIWGGGEVIVEQLVRGLTGRGHELVLLCRPGSPLFERLRGEVPCEPILRGFDLNPRAVWQSVRALRRHRPQVVMATTVKDPRLVGPAAKLLGVPLILRHGNDEPLKPRLRYRLYVGVLPEWHVANSEATRQTLLRSAPWLDPDRVSVIYNGIDVERFRTATPLDLDLPEGAVTVGFIGRFLPRKGIRELCEAWPRVAAAVPDAHLVIAGRGEWEPAMRAWLAEAPRVHWLGFQREVPTLMKALDLLAVPSHFEGFGLVLAEAMAAGTAVVASRASNLPELVDDGVEGRLVPVGDAAALADALIELASDATRRTAMAALGERRATRDFTLARMLDEYEALFARVGPRAARASAPHRPSLSVVMIVQNEELRLPRTLESVRWADEIVIVDSGSTDGTAEIARRYTDRFYVLPWEGFGRQKQRALDRATGDWVLAIDADEVVTPELRASIEEAIRRPGEAAGFRMELHTAFLGAWLGSRGWHREWKVRLFRRDRARFDENVVHEGISLDGPVATLRGTLLHYHFRDLDHHVEKMNRYTTLMARRDRERGKRGGVGRAVLHGSGNFFKSFLLRGEFLHGRAGFMDAALSGVYGFLKYAKLWEMQQASAEGLQPAEAHASDVSEAERR